MSVARTARRRRRQASLGAKGLEQIYGKRHTPHYPHPLTEAASAKREMRYRENKKKIMGRGKK